MKSITEAYLKVISGKQEEVNTEQLTETTVPEELHHIPESWDHHSEVSDKTSEKIRAAMTKGSFTHFPLHDEHHDGDPDVIEHLTNHGYEIKDYKKGIASIKKQVGNPEKGIPYTHKYVDESIGSILNKTNATPEVKTAFVNDPSRASSKSKTHVVISTSPLAIAGMSTGTTWKDQSCMNMEGGALPHKLEDDSRHGTHVAFLVHHDDTAAFHHGEPSKPIARIALKPYHTSGQDRDTIFRPETKTYGTDTSAFTTAVSRWASENYPAETDKTYIKDRNVYDDTDNYQYTNLSKEKLEWHIRNEVPLQNSGSIDHDTISHGIDYIKNSVDKKDTAVSMLSTIGNLSTAHVLKLNKLHDSSGVLRTIMMRHGDKASTSMMNTFMQNNVLSIPRRMLMNPKLSDEHLDMVDPKEYQFVRRSRLKDKHMTKLVDSIKSKTFLMQKDHDQLHAFKDKLKPEHLIELTKSHELYDIYHHIIDSTNFNNDAHDALVNSAVKLHSNIHTRYDATRVMDKVAKKSKFVSIEDVEKIPTETMYSGLAKNTNISSDTHKKLKDLFIENSTGGKPDSVPSRYTSRVFGFSYYTIPKTLSDHMQTEDFDKLVEHNYQTVFKDKKASNEFLDASERKMHRLDNAISEHTSFDDDTHDALINKLQNHIQNHAENIDGHISHHVENDNGRIDDSEEHEKTLNRILGKDNNLAIHHLENYSHPEVEQHKFNLDSEEHYGEHVKPLIRRLTRMQPVTK